MLGARPDGTVEFADGSSVRADVVVAADGVHSRIRDGLDLMRSFKRLPDGATRVLIPRHEEPNSTEYWAGPHRVGVVPCHDDWTYVFLIGPEARRAVRAIPVDRDYWKSLYPHIADVIDRIPDEGRPPSSPRGHLHELGVGPRGAPRRCRARPAAELRPGSGRGVCRRLGAGAYAGRPWPVLAQPARLGATRPPLDRHGPAVDDPLSHVGYRGRRRRYGHGPNVPLAVGDAVDGEALGILVAGARGPPGSLKPTWSRRRAIDPLTLTAGQCEARRTRDARRQRSRRDTRSPDSAMSRRAHRAGP